MNMKIEEFVNKAKKQDKRNAFSLFEGKLVNIPIEFSEFYKNYNPVDVEIRTKRFGNIWFCPVEKIYEIKSEYYFYPDSAFIFATSNGDPIFMENGKIYTSYESDYSPEFIANSLDDFFNSCFI